MGSMSNLDYVKISFKIILSAGTLTKVSVTILNQIWLLQRSITLYETLLEIISQTRTSKPLKTKKCDVYFEHYSVRCQNFYDYFFNYVSTYRNFT